MRYDARQVNETAMTDHTPKYLALHVAYCAQTGLDLPFTMERLLAWEQWCSCGWDEGDLCLVIKHLRHKLRREPKQRLLGALRFRWLVEAHEDFAETLAEARALNRGYKLAPNREEVLRATGRETRPKSDTALSAGEILAGNERFRKFCELKGKL